MNKRERRLMVIERRWQLRFGEPPAIRTDPAIMLRVLEAADREAADEPKSRFALR
jgi:hypothetical protein